MYIFVCVFVFNKLIGLHRRLEKENRSQNSIITTKYNRVGFMMMTINNYSYAFYLVSINGNTILLQTGELLVMVKKVKK